MGPTARAHAQRCAGSQRLEVALNFPYPLGDVEAVHSQHPPGLSWLLSTLLQNLSMDALRRLQATGYSPTSRVELLVGAKPRGASLERYGFRFVVAGQHGRELAWRVERS
jgi:hypothetical protein